MHIICWGFVYVRTGYWITGAGVTDCEPFVVAWEPTLDPLQEKYVLHSEPLSHLFIPQKINVHSGAK